MRFTRSLAIGEWHRLPGKQLLVARMHCVAGMVLAGEPERTASRSLSAAQSHRLEDGCSITDSVSAGHARDPEPSRVWSSLVWRPALGHEACSRKRSHV
jgi:hypothetical protein